MRLRPDTLPCAMASALLLATASVANATVTVFSDPGGTNQGVTFMNEQSGQALQLWVEIGPTPSSGTACRSGAGGDEVCAFHLEFQVDGGGFIEGFSGISGAQWWPSDPLDFATGTVRNLKVAFVGGHDPGPSGPGALSVGTLTVDASPPGGTMVRVIGKNAVDGGLGIQPVPSDTVALTMPEPGTLAGLASGALALAGLRRLRRARRGRGDPGA